MSYKINANAKINLALHITGVTENNMHKIDSIVTFVNIYDTIEVKQGSQNKFTTKGKFASEIKQKNIIEKTAEVMREKYAPAKTANIKLTKNLPVAAGIGGGSADAAATIIALNKIWRLKLSQKEIQKLAQEIGADVPMCVSGDNARVKGTGEQIKQINMPSFGIVVVNPKIQLLTKDVFQKLRNKNNKPINNVPKSKSKKEWIAFLKKCRNDLQETATKQVPQINDCINKLQKSGAEVVRMSGAGPTCFGIYLTHKKAQDAAKCINQKYWVRIGKTK